MWLNELKVNFKRIRENYEMWTSNDSFNENEYNLWLSRIEGKRKDDGQENEWKIMELEKKLVEDDDSKLLDKIDSSVFEDAVNQDELREICKNLIKNWLLGIDEKGRKKKYKAYIDVWWEKRPSKLFESFIKAWFLPKQALKIRLQVRTKTFKDWFGDREKLIPQKENTTDTVGGSPVALSYLLEGGPTTIKSTGYLLHGISAAFELITNEVESIRSKYLKQLNDNPSTFIYDNTWALQEMRDIIEKTYGQQGINILNDILNNATGFYEREGRKISNRLNELNTTIKNSQNKNVSKVVDENGEPLLVYHGSAKRFKEFDIEKIGSTTGDKSGFYFSDRRGVAKHYYSRETGNARENSKLILGIKYKPTVYDCFIRAFNPYIHDFGGNWDNIGREELIAEKKESGHDCVILRNIIDGPSLPQDVYVVFHPDQIKIERIK